MIRVDRVRLHALIQQWEEEATEWHRQADWLDGCNGREWNLEKRLMFRTKAETRKDCVVQLRAVLLVLGDGRDSSP